MLSMVDIFHAIKSTFVFTRLGCRFGILISAALRSNSIYLQVKYEQTNQRPGQAPIQALRNIWRPGCMQPALLTGGLLFRLSSIRCLSSIS